MLEGKVGVGVAWRNTGEGGLGTKVGVRSGASCWGHKEQGMPCWEEDQGRMGVRRGWLFRLGDLGEGLEGARTYTTRRTCTWGSTCETMSEWSMTRPRVINSPAGDRPSDFGRDVRRRRVALLIRLLHGLGRGIITWHVMRVGHSFLTRRRWGHVSVGRVHAVRRHVPIGSGWVTSAAVYVKSGTAGMGRGD